MENAASVLNEGLQDIVDQIKASLRSADRVATGKTLEKITIEIEEGSGKVIGRIYAPSYITNLEDGRKPTENNSGTGWKDSLLEWIRARGIDEDALYPIYKKINEKGYKGTEGVLSDPIKKGVEELRKKIQLQIVNGFKL